MYKILGMTAVAALLAGCADEVVEEIVPTDEEFSVCADPEDSETCIPIPASGGVVSVGDLQAVSYNGTELRVQIALDGPDAFQAYELDTAARSDDYKKFTFSASDLNRAFTAFAGRSTNGEVVAVVAMDKGQFNDYFAGATVVQDQDSFSRPTAGTASYLGDYIGLIKTDVGSAPVEVTGLVFLNANFTDKVEGEMTGRSIPGETNPISLSNLVFMNTDIQNDGIFAGQVQIEDGGDTGAYGGAFGGSRARFAGGFVSVSGDLGGVDGEEFGIFVIETCGAVGTDCFPD